ncbi:MAG TPA: hypothetical protein VGI45_17640 [Terracidiphilus sp.]
MTLSPSDQPALQLSRATYCIAIFTAALLACIAVPSRCAAADDTNAPAKALRDGSHDFDFNVGVWHTHIRRILDPLSGSPDFIELNGTVTVRKVWGGRAELEEIETDGPKGRWEGLSLFLYNPQSHQWSQSFLNSQRPDLGTPLIGEFRDGRADLFGGDTFKGKSIIVRGVWSDVQPDSHRYVESYSDDGGQTWKESFHADLTRDKRAAQQDGSAISDLPQTDNTPADDQEFAFDLGEWHTQSKRLLHPLTGSNTWVEMDGRTNVTKVWGGRANLAEYDADGSGGHITLLSLRWFNPVTHEWNLDFATPQVGMLGIPGIGTFKDGRGDFYDYESIGGRSLLVRFSIWKTSSDTAQSEQAFSDDGGKTWEVNWINHYTRLKPN